MSEQLDLQSMLGFLETTIAGMKEEAVKGEHEDSCNEMVFEYLATYPAAYKLFPGLESPLSMDLFGIIEDEEARETAKKFFNEALKITNQKELGEHLANRYRTHREYMDFLSFWNGEPSFDLEEIDEKSRTIFRLFKAYAEKFKDVVGDKGFMAFDLAERMNLIRLAYAAGVIEPQQYASGMRYTGYLIATYFDNWDDYIRSYICGSAYDTFTHHSDESEALNNIIIMTKYVKDSAFYKYGWISDEEKEALVKEFDKDDDGWKMEYKEDSFMVALCDPDKEADTLETAVERLKNSDIIEVLGFEKESTEDGDYYSMGVVVDDEEYDLTIECIERPVPEMFRMLHFFKDLDLEKLGRASAGIAVTMPFNDNKLGSYHAQLKIMDALMPEALCILDEGSEKILSAKWVKLAASSNVPPSPRYLFTVQAVSEQDKSPEVWLHTHGLNRCGIPELEILGSDGKNYNNHYNLIDIMAKRFLDGVTIEEGEPLFLAHITNEVPFIGTIMNYKDAIEQYDNITLGNMEDREEGHNHDTYAILCYPDEASFNERKASPVNVFDDLLSANPVFMISSEETARMRDLAQERISYMKKLFAKGGSTVLAKVGLEVDEEHKEKCSGFEHIYFEVKEIGDDHFKAELTQEPYFIAGLHKGAVMDIDYKNITDWIVMNEGGRITPDDVYIIAE